MTRYRMCIGVRCGGVCDGNEVETKSCNKDCCQTDGTWSEWTLWSNCSSSCGNGLQSRKRECTGSSCGGSCDGQSTETRACSSGCCPVNGTWSDWSDWSLCPVTCGGGVQSRQRDCIGSECGGYCEGMKSETQACNIECCPVNGTWSDWSGWSLCPVTCGGGAQSRQRDCIGSECGGHCEGMDSEIQTCNTECCPVNGSWSGWSNWTDCSVTCGEGTQNRTRDCLGFSCGGFCEGTHIDERQCNMGCCPQDGIWTKWSEWSDCTQHGKLYVQNRTRLCNGTSCGGQSCQGESVEYQACEPPHCLGKLAPKNVKLVDINIY